MECQLTDIMERWSVERFTFASAWRNRAVPTLANSDAIVAQLDEAQTALQAMLALHYIGPFRAEARSLQTLLSETADTLARWSKVQQLWCALEPVFTSGDIARQNPKQAKRFLKVDKDRSGAVTQLELTRVLKEEGYVFDDGDLASLLQQFDTNGDGVIAYDEFAQMIRQAPQLR